MDRQIRWKNNHPLRRKLTMVARHCNSVKGLLKILERMYKEYPYCEYCHIGLNSYEVSLDHKIPISKGGPADNPNNWAICCKDCNYLKGSKTSLEFMVFIKEYIKRFKDNIEPSLNKIQEGVTTRPEITATNTLVFD